jgi:hypothetical protein
MSDVTSSDRFSPFRFSLRNLLIFVAFFSIACIALKYAGPIWWTILSGISLVLVMAVAVRAFVGRGEQRVFAIGFTVCGVIYGGLLFASGAWEFDPYSGRMPTTTAMLPLFRLVAVSKFVHLGTGQEVPPPAPGANVSHLAHSETPSRRDFMSTAHVLWADLLAIVGGFFTCFIYSRSGRPELTAARPIP